MQSTIGVHTTLAFLISSTCHLKLRFVGLVTSGLSRKQIAKTFPAQPTPIIGGLLVQDLQQAQSSSQKFPRITLSQTHNFPLFKISTDDGFEDLQQSFEERLEQEASFSCHPKTYFRLCSCSATHSFCCITSRAGGPRAATDPWNQDN